MMQMLMQVFDKSQAQKKAKQVHFEMNLERLASGSSIVTVDCMIEVLTHIQNESIKELLFIEIEYLKKIFEDTELDLAVCSVEVSCFLFVEINLQNCLMLVPDKEM